MTYSRPLGRIKMSAVREDSFSCFVNSENGKELVSLVVKEKESVVVSCVG